MPPLRNLYLFELPKCSNQRFPRLIPQRPRHLRQTFPQPLTHNLALTQPRQLSRILDQTIQIRPNPNLHHRTLHTQNVMRLYYNVQVNSWLACQGLNGNRGKSCRDITERSAAKYCAEETGPSRRVSSREIWEANCWGTCEQKR
jgi:hypothetical protein